MRAWLVTANVVIVGEHAPVLHALCLVMIMAAVNVSEADCKVLDRALE